MTTEAKAMPSYYYHLKLELYPSSDPKTSVRELAGGGLDGIWSPSPGSSIFDHLPAHPRRAQTPLIQTRPQQAALSWATADPKSRDTRPIGAATGVIDCGATRAPTHDDDDQGRNLVLLTERQWRARSKSVPPPRFYAGFGPKTAAKDWRFGRINIESFDLVKYDQEVATSVGHLHQGTSGWDNMLGYEGESSHAAPAASLGPNLGGPGQATKGRYVPLETQNTEAGWGIVHLYREGIEQHSVPPQDSVQEGSSSSAVESTDGENGAILCIPSVPSYLSPSDFLGFVGEKWRGDVSHYRMVMTSRMNRYMVLMKFRDNRRARDWRKEFDGKVFNSMEAEICNVTFIKSITIETPNRTKSLGTDTNGSSFASSSAAVVHSPKPFPPPTPNLIELPTCSVCLERMDDTAGLMTILCQHVFHCTCLQTWKGTGCPVCRATNPKPKEESYDPNNPYAQPFGNGVSNFCSVCDCSTDLWICLICGNVGCGRYKGGHAKDHWKETAHSFSLELETQHVWDYAGDMWVHRLIREKGDGKVVELPSNDRNSGHRRQGPGAPAEDEDVVPRAKLDSIGMEYTHLLTSQLESQRVYFEELVKKAVDKAAHASAAAESAKTQANEALKELAEMRTEHRKLTTETIPALERDLERERSRATKSTELARSLGKSLQEEKKVSEGLLARVKHVNKEVDAVRKQLDELKVENAELKDTNHDLTMFISGQEKLKEMENEGQLEQGELEEGTASVPEDRRRGKGKGKAKR